MKALVVEDFGPVGSHEIKEVATLVPDRSEVLIKVHAIALNFPDALMLQGKYQKRPPLPFVPGRDASGTVVALGDRVTRFKVGDAVVCQVFSGAFAEFVSAPETRCFGVRPGADFGSAAAMMTVFNTAYVAVHLRAKATAGQTAVITGAAGGVGLAALQLLNNLGARAFAIVSSKEKADLVLANGAERAIILGGDNRKDQIYNEVMDASCGRGVDHVFETIGGEMFASTLRTLGFDGKMVVIGFASAEIPSAKANYLLYKNLSVIGAPLDIQFDHHYDSMVDGVRLMQDLYLQGKIKPNIMKTLPFENILEAFTMITRREVLGKIILKVS